MSYKIVISGMTAQQIGNGTRLGYGPVIDLMRDALVDAGCTVEHRRMIPDEPLDDIDCLIIGQIPLHAMGATYAYGALDAIRRAKSAKTGMIWLIDDWQIGNLGSGVRTICKGPHRLVKELFRTCRKDWDWATEHLDELMTVVQAMKDRPWPPTIMPKFAWGDPTTLVKPLNSREFIYVDPSAYATEYPTVIPPDSERYGAWVLGILSDQREWINSLGLGWPVSYIGSKKSKAPEPMKEVDLVQRYAQCWGVLSPPYNHAGSGWWRNRFVYTARTRGIMLADEKEVAPIGDAYRIKASEVEGLNTQQLRELADAQWSQLMAWQWSKEQVQSVLMDAVRRAVEEAK